MFVPFDRKKSIGVNKAVAYSFRLMKRKRALLESIPPRNSQLKTHPDDEKRASIFGSAPSSSG